MAEHVLAGATGSGSSAERYQVSVHVSAESLRGAVDSDDPPEKVAACIQAAENGCFVMQTILEPTEVKRTVRLNGEVLPG